MENKFEIRKAANKDLDSVYGFICHLEETRFAFEAFEEIYLENIENPDCVYLVAANDADEVIGFLSCHSQKLLHHSGIVYEIQELYVGRNYRGAGIGKMLIRTLEEKLEKSGQQSLEVSVNAKRTDAKKFYAKMGFAPSHIKLVKQPVLK
jgi:PhnO protein